MNQVFPNLSNVLASSTTDVGVLSTYLFPVIVFAFICVVVAASILFMINLLFWLGSKISGHTQYGVGPEGWYDKNADLHKWNK